MEKHCAKENYQMPALPQGAEKDQRQKGLSLLRS